MAKKKSNTHLKENKKVKDLSRNFENASDGLMTTNQGLLINDDQNSLKSGERGSSLLEDFILREKITHFDHERIPERIVHARGVGAHGYFQVYKPMREYTKAKFLNDPALQTPVFVRFSTVAGFRGSSDLARDVRGFAVKFYTEEGNYDLVGNNIPVFFIQDAMKFPDLIHSVKPEPNNEIPQAASAHNTFWDFISLMPEAMHMIMWVMSDRAIPRSLRMMEGFGVHTFRFINEKEQSVFVKFHWKPLLGIHSVAWSEAQMISGKDPDFHRRDLFEAIESGNFPEWELGVQIVKEKDEHSFDFDLLDPTKLIPEELVPVQRIGKLTLNKNPDNYFAETEQVAFHPGHLVPGIDFSNDPLLQGRLFSYTDTQLSRLGGPNFHEIPINRPVKEVHNNQRDGHMRQQINASLSSYNPNSTGGGCPFQAKMAEGGFTSYNEKIDAKKVRARSQSFFDHFSQASLFYRSQSEEEKRHLTDALTFELSKVDVVPIREKMILLLTKVDSVLAKNVADGIGVDISKVKEQQLNYSVPADGDVKKFQPSKAKPSFDKSMALSMQRGEGNTIKTRQVAVLAADGVDDILLNKMKRALEAQAAKVKIIAPKMGAITSTSGKLIKVDESFLIATSVVYDAVYVPGGVDSISTLLAQTKAKDFLNEAFDHCKPIAADKEGVDFVTENIDAGIKGKPANKAKKQNIPGVVLNGSAKDFITAISKHRFWEREEKK